MSRSLEDRLAAAARPRRRGEWLVWAALALVILVVLAWLRASGRLP